MTEEARTKGNEYFDAGEFDQAINAYREALQAAPNDEDLRNDLGLAYFMRTRYDEALEQYKKALELDSDHLDAHINIANLYVERGFLNDALYHYYQALQLDDSSAWAHYNLGYTLMVMGKYKLAADELRAALKYQEGFVANIYLYLGWSLAHLRDLNGALVNYKKVLDQEPDNQTGHTYMALALHELGLEKEARQEAETALELAAKADNKLLEADARLTLRKILGESS